MNEAAFLMWAHRDSNPGPPDYESGALTSWAIGPFSNFLEKRLQIYKLESFKTNNNRFFVYYFYYPRLNRQIHIIIGLCNLSTIMYYEKKNGPKKYTPNQALAAMQKYCATQERCHEDVKNLLIKHQVYGDDLDNILIDLVQNNFLNEERYAEAFARGRFKMKKWGRKKIIYGLKAKRISTYCINKGLAQIDEEDYINTLIDVLQKKYIILESKQLGQYEILKKLSAFAIQKGYEPHLVYEEAKAIVF